MTHNEARRELLKRGIVITTKNGTGHLALYNPANGKRSVMPMHGSKEIGKGLWKAILKQLDIE